MPDSSGASRGVTTAGADVGGADIHADVCDARDVDVAGGGALAVAINGDERPFPIIEAGVTDESEIAAVALVLASLAYVPPRDFADAAPDGAGNGADDTSDVSLNNLNDFSDFLCAEASATVKGASVSAEESESDAIVLHSWPGNSSHVKLIAFHAGFVLDWVPETSNFSSTFCPHRT